MLQKPIFTNYYHFCLKNFLRCFAPLPISILKFGLFFLQFAHECQLFRFPGKKISSFSHIFAFFYTNFHHFEPKSVASRRQMIFLPIITVFRVSSKCMKKGIFTNYYFLPIILIKMVFNILCTKSY